MAIIRRKFYIHTLLFLSMSSRPALELIQPPIQWLTGASSTGIKLPRKTDHSTPTSAEVKKTWLYTSTPLYVFMM
jgi:hypothetical protein